MSKKITFIHHFGGLGGAGKSLINNILLLSENYDITVILPKKPTEIHNEIAKIKNVKILKFIFIPSLPIYSGGLRFYDPRFLIHMIKSFYFASNFVSLIKKTEPDFLVVNSIITSWLSCYFKDVKSICFIRETFLNSPFKKLQKSFLNNFTKVVFISKYDSSVWNLDTQNYVIQNYFEPDNHYLLSASNDDISNSNLDDNSINSFLKILFLGGTSYIKGFYFLLLAILKTKHKHKIELVVLGNSNKKIASIVNFLFKRSLKIVFHGNVQNVSVFYSYCDLVIFPVVKVHQGRPIFEAGFFKKPVLVPNYDNFTEYVEHDFNGLVYNRHSISSLSLILDNLALNKSVLESLGNNNYLLSSGNHRKNVVEKLILELFS